MKKRYAVSVILLFGVAVGALLFWSRLNQNTYSSASIAPSHIPGKSKGAILETHNTERQFERSREEKVKRLLNEGNVPIEFWGLVVDQDARPILDAVISYRIHRAGRLEPSGFVGDDSRRGQVASARDGGFSIMGDRGVTLSIESIQKSGYRQAAKQRMDFAFQGSPEPFTPSPRQPQTFVLIHSESMPLLVRYSSKLALPWDSHAMRCDLLNGQASPSGELIIVASRGEPDPRGRFDWRLTISVDGGGVVEANEQGAHIAPAGEYEPAWACGFEATSQPWRFGLTKQLYFKTSKGVFGRLNLQIYADAKPTGTGLLIEGFLNPTGSRLLEYDANGVTQ